VPFLTSSNRASAGTGESWQDEESCGIMPEITIRQPQPFRDSPLLLAVEYLPVNALLGYEIWSRTRVPSNVAEQGICEPTTL
jgi:hypothetical protein